MLFAKQSSRGGTGGYRIMYIVALNHLPTISSMTKLTKQVSSVKSFATDVASLTALLAVCYGLLAAAPLLDRILVALLRGGEV